MRAPRMDNDCKAGEYVSTYIRSFLAETPEDRNEAKAHLETLVRSATLTRDVAEEEVSVTPGLVPVFIIGDLIKFVDATRYVVNSFRDLPMPAGGKTFNRPLVTQRTIAGVQVNEFDELTSQTLAISPDTVTKQTHGTVLNLSEQDIDWTDPALLQIAIEDMAESYAISTESAACEALEDACTPGNNNVGHLSLTADSAIFMSSVAAAAANVYNTSKRLPDTLYAAPDRWAYLIGLTDDDGRPLFPHLSPVNAFGVGDLSTFRMESSIVGLDLVVSPFFQHGFFAVAASQFCEQYEQNKGLLQIPVPSTLSLVVAYRGYFATLVQPKALFSMDDLNVGGGSWSS